MRMVHKPTNVLHESDGTRTKCGMPTGGPMWMRQVKTCPDCYIECPVCIEAELNFRTDL